MFAVFATFDAIKQGMGVAMRGDDQICGHLFSYIDLEARVETEHPLRAIREIANTALAALTDEFEALYSGLGRPSITTGLGDRQADNATSGYGKSQRVRKRIEEAFGWIKTVAGLRKTKLKGLAKVDWAFTFAAAAYNLVRLPKLVGAA